MDTAAAIVEQVRELHKPQERRYIRSVAHECHGCDPGSRAEDLPDWPCATAEIVYTPDELAAVRAYEIAQDQRVQRVPVNPGAPEMISNPPVGRDHRTPGAPTPEVTPVFGLVTNRQLQLQLDAIAAKVDIIMTQQDDINAAAQQIEQDVAAENTALAAIQAEIATLQAGNPALDLTALNAAVADLGTAAAAEEAVVPPTG